MRAMTLVHYLLGRRGAIEEVATHPDAMKVGLLFVLTAGFAREYDQEYLLREPWHLFLPLVVSTALALVLGTLFWMMRPMAGHRRPGLLTVYRMFIALIWMMAPMAWVYAIPYERFTEAGPATQANLLTLALVAGWRVILLSRVIAVGLGLSGARAFMIVMLLADAAVLTALAIMPLPLFSVMGGIRLSASEQAIASTTFLVMSLGTLTLPIWILGAVIGVCGRTDWHLAYVANDSRSVDHGRLAWLAAAGLILGVSLLPATQPEQARRWHVESSMRAGEIASAIAFMSRYQTSDFPPHWDPPPRAGYGERVPAVTDIVRTMDPDDSAEWVRAIYATKLDHDLRDDAYVWRRDWTDIAEDTIDGRGRDAAEWYGHISALQSLMAIKHDLTDTDRSAIRRIIEWSEASERE